MLGWVVFGYAFVGSEAISQEVVAAKVLEKPNDYQAVHQTMQVDIRTLTATQLRLKYPREYNSHRNAKAAPKTRAISFDSRLLDFRNFLQHVGPCPRPDHKNLKNCRYTLERIKGRNSAYKIGNLEWASKRKQTSTRNVAKWQKLKDGTPLTTKQLANRAGKSYNTVYKQLARGRSPDEILIHVSADLMTAWTWPAHLQHLEHAYRKRTKHKLCRLHWAIDLFRSQLQVAIFEEVAEDDVNKLASELDSLEVERELRIGKMKIDKKSQILDFIASISKEHSNLFLASALPALPKE